jgi:hypothetical protein
MLISEKCKAVFSEIDVSDRSAKDKMRSAPVLDEGALRSLFEKVPEDAEQQLRTQPEEQD